jgi:hypothetical protein
MCKAVAGYWRPVGGAPDPKLVHKPDSGYAAELDFWQDYLAKHRASATDPRSWESAFPTDLRRWVGVLTEKRGQLEALELGSGPVSLLAWGVKERLFRLTALDPLADEYAKLMDDCSYPIAPVIGFGEELSELFPPKHFRLGVLQ